MDHTPDPLEELLLNSVPNTSTPKLKVPPLWVSGGLDSEEEGVEDTRMKKKKKGDTTISSMVLPSEEKLSKENLRKYVKERKGKKLAEFVGLRESRGARDVSQTTVSPSRSPLHSPVQNKSRKASYTYCYLHACAAICPGFLSEGKLREKVGWSGGLFDDNTYVMFV